MFRGHSDTGHPKTAWGDFKYTVGAVWPQNVAAKMYRVRWGTGVWDGGEHIYCEMLISLIAADTADAVCVYAI